MMTMIAGLPTVSHSTAFQGDQRVHAGAFQFEDRREGRIWRWSLPLLFLATLVLRLQNLDSQPWGDEAYYYFITHDLAAFWNTGLYPLSGSTFPVFPLVYHFFAGNFESLRVANAIAGALAVSLGMVVMRETGVGRVATLCAGAFLAIDTVLVMFSGMAFLDMLGAVIGLSALLAYLRGNYAVAAALVAVAVLEKEYYCILGVAFAVDQLIARRRVYVELMIAAIPVVGWALLRYAIQGASFHYLLSAHAHDSLTVGLMDQAVGSLALVPLAAASVLFSARLRSAALYVGIFLVALRIWGNAQPWYWCLSVILATVLAAHGMTLVLAGSTKRRLAVGIVAMLWLIAFASQAVTTYRYLATWHGRDVDRVAAYLDGQSPQRVDTVGCASPYTYYPLGNGSRQVTMLDGWSGASDGIAVACPKAPPAPDGWRPLYRAGQYTVLGHQTPFGPLASPYTEPRVSLQP